MGITSFDLRTRKMVYVCILSRTYSLNIEVTKFQKARNAFGSSNRKEFWKWLRSMVILFILKSLLYACETWIIYSYHLKQLQRFHQQHFHQQRFHQQRLRGLLGINWRIRDNCVEVLERSQSGSIEAIILKYMFCWMVMLFTWATTDSNAAFVKETES